MRRKAPSGAGAIGRHGLPGYTYRYASRQSASKLRYLGRLFAKEIVLANFPGAPREELLERMVELEVYMNGVLR